MATGVSGSGATSNDPVASAKTVSPSTGVWQGRMVWASPSWAATATRRHPAGAQRRVGGHDGDGGVERALLAVEFGERRDLSGRRRAEPEVLDQVGHPRQPRGGVDDVAGRIDDHDRADRHAVRNSVELHRRGPHAALEHSGTGAHPGADVPTATSGPAASAAARPNSAVGRQPHPPTGRSKITAPGTIGTRPPSIATPAAVGFQPRHHAVGGRQSVGTATASAGRRRRDARCWRGRADRFRGYRVRPRARRPLRRFRAGRAPRSCRSPSPHPGVASSSIRW